MNIGRDAGAVQRRSLFAGALGTAGMVITGCSTPFTTEANSGSSGSSTPCSCPGNGQAQPDHHLRSAEAALFNVKQAGKLSRDHQAGHRTGAVLSPIAQLDA
jgi:hypothetical protein